MLLPVVGNLLVEVSVLLLGDVLGLSHPQWLILVDLLVLGGDLLDLLLLLLLLLLLDFTLVLLLLFLFLFVVGNLLLSGLLDLKLNGESDELGVLLDQVLEASFLEELEVVALQVADNHGTSGKSIGVVAIINNSECATGS